MENLKHLYGPVPSRRLGLSLGVSPIPNKTCNYSCIYCQLGRTNHLKKERKLFEPVDEIVDELKFVISQNIEFDVITIVGEGEPTLYLGLGELIDKIHNLSTKPVVVITNGSLFSDETVIEALKKADIILPSLDATNEFQFKQINRPHKFINYADIIQGLIDFSNEFSGELWIEIMLVKGINDDEISLNAFLEILKKIKYSRLYINSPVRPPAEKDVCEVDEVTMEKAIKILKGISIDKLSSEGFHSEIKDDFEAVISTIQRHPMNQFEILDFLKSRACSEPERIIERLNSSDKVESVYYKGYNTYRIKNI